MIEVSWYNSGDGILLWAYPAEWTIDMYDEAFEQSIALAANYEGRLDVIEDQRATNVIPRRYLYHVLDRHEDLNAEKVELGIVVILAEKPKMQFITQMANALPNVDKRFHLAPTLEEATKFIQEDRKMNNTE